MSAPRGFAWSAWLGAGLLGVGCTRSAAAPRAVVPANAAPSSATTAAPSARLAPDQVVRLAAGSTFACAARADGSAWCFGANDRAQLGSPGPARGEAVRVPGLAGVTQVAAGHEHALALDGDGVVWGWGSNSFGKAGLRPDPGRPIAPTRTALPGRATRVAAGEQHSCALLEDGAVWCWGRNAEGELGADYVPAPPRFGGPNELPRHAPAGPRPVEDHPPVRVPLPGPASALVALGQRTAALVAGEVWEWGASSYRLDRHPERALGGAPALTELEVRPERLAELGAVRALALGRTHLYAVSPAGALRAWAIVPPTWHGLSWPPRSATDAPIVYDYPAPLRERLATIAAAEQASCALRDDGAVLCWGNEPWLASAGLRGDGTHARPGPPVPVPNLRAALVAVGRDFACAAGTDAQGAPGLWYWGLVYGPHTGEPVPPATTVATRVPFAASAPTPPAAQPP